MKLKMFIVGLVCGVMSFEGMLGLQAQQATSRSASPDARSPFGQNLRVPAYSGATRSTQVNGITTVAGPSWRPGQNQRQREIQGELQSAFNTLKQSESESDREDAIKSLRGVLGDQYDESLDQYEEYLQSLEEKIKKMKAQIEKRRDAKMDLVDLRLKTMVNEADGLGWPEGQSGRLPGYFGTPGPMDPFSQAAPRLVIPNTQRKGTGR